MVAASRRREVPRLLLIVLAVLLTLASLVLVIWVLPPALVQSQLPKTAKISDTDRLKAINDVRGALLTSLSVLAVFGGSMIAYLNFQGTLTLNRRGQLTERFSKAVEQLGQSDDSKLNVRVGGIYALEQIAQDSEELHWPVMDVLLAFLRAHAQFKQGGPARPWLPEDHQAAATVLGRRQLDFEDPRRVLVLRDVDLRGVDWQDARLERANLSHAHLEGADLRGACLKGVDLSDAHLEDALLQRANLEGAGVRITRRDQARVGPHFSETTDFSGADLSGTDLSAASGVTEKQLLGAKVNHATKLPWSRGAHGMTDSAMRA